MNFNYFNSVLQSFPADDRIKFLEILKEWSTFSHWSHAASFCYNDHNKLVDNFQYEHFLEIPKFEELISFFLKAYKNDILALLLDVQQEIYKYNYQLQGGSVHVMPTYIGTVIPKVYFYKYLINDKYQNLICQIFP